MRSLSILVFIITVLTIIGCDVTRPRGTSTITGINYDKNKDKTTYMVLPYGSVIMPGKWKEKRYNPTSRQQFFQRGDSIQLAVSIGPSNKLEFYKAGLSAIAFSNAYYEWETKYQRANLRQKTALIKQDTANGYTLWRIYSDSVNTFQLVATTKCQCDGPAFKNITINSLKLSNEQKIQLLEAIYLNK